MKTNWRSYFSLPLNVREEMYKRGVDDEIKNFIEFEKALKEEESEEEIEEEKDLEFTEKSNGKITIIKGDDPEMINEFDDLGEAIESYLGEPVEEEFYELEEKLSATNRKALVEAVNILRYYKEEIAKNPELKTSLLTLVKFVGFGAGYPIKKELEKSEPVLFNWKSFINNMTEKAEEDQSVSEEIEKADPNDKFPSLTRGLLKSQKKREKAQTERDLERRFI